MTDRKELADRLERWANMSAPLRELQDDLCAAASIIRSDDWRPISEAPHACHVLATRWSEDDAEWIVAVVMSPPNYPFTHYHLLPDPPLSRPTPIDAGDEGS